MGKRARENGSFLGLSGIFILVGLVFLVLGGAVDGKRNPTSAAEKDLEIERKLKLINKPAVKSIQSEDGDTIDCVEIDNQPAFDHPLLKGHKIQMRPGFDNKEEDTKDAAASPSMVLQVWKKNGSCPEGSIPIRRVRKSDLSRAHSPETFGMKTQHIPNITNDKAGANLLADAVLITLGYRYNGASASINVWNPFLETSDEYTSAQFWLQSGPNEASDSIETGWMVNPSIYGDKRTRLFTSWTSKGKGCYDLICSGFVQVSKEVALGAAIEPISSHGEQKEIRLQVAMDPKTSYWWLRFDNRIDVGYWPGPIFESLSVAATSVVWGGEVYSKRLGSPHTRTGMGSGEFAELRWGRSCFISKLRIRDNSMAWKYPEWTSPYQTQFNCYDVFLDKETTPDDPYFYFGGPGLNDKCP